ncbi:MAG: hypothetical protein B6U95_00225 [Thermofilum sp. ex4484_82]|nr:MAG: hypothetical protein B6U95_00225 [Thermofilum sp. ex4484_82]OYT40156.1 MAG: hypothetical protein B6U96_00225 [Archaeoglobales archaeon ex4484_92]
MGYEIAIVVGWMLPEFCKVFNIAVESDWCVMEEKVRQISKTIEDLLVRAQVEAYKEASIITDRYQLDKFYIVAKTPNGVRKFLKWDLQLLGDEFDVGDEYPDEFVVGVEVGSLLGADPFQFTVEDILPLLKIAKKHLERMDQRFKTAKTIVKLIHT